MQPESRKSIKMKPRVLIIDDDRAITQQLFWTLCDDYEVMTASDLQSAVRRATIYEPAFSILNLYLPPVLDTPEVGLQVLEFIKSRFPHSKILVISSDANAETQKACFEGGADSFLDKPFEIENLLAAMRRITSQHGSSTG